MCMSHRMPEDHSCASFRRAALATRGPVASLVKKKAGDGGSASASGKAVGQTSKLAGQRAGKKAVDPSNTLAGTAHLRAERLAAAGRPAAPPVSSSLTSEGGSFACPMCGVVCVSLQDITRHIEADHLDGPVSSKSNNIDLLAARSGEYVGSSVPSAGGSEVRMQCLPSCCVMIGGLILL